MELVLSLFPGIDLLGRGFEAAGFAVVRGPDTLWDARIEDFRSAGRFDGVIGGPPCQNYSDANRTRRPEEGDRLVGHFLRIIDEARSVVTQNRGPGGELGHDVGTRRTWHSHAYSRARAAKSASG